MARGYTLVELLLVLVLTVILAIDVASHAPGPSLNAAAVASQVEAAVRLAQIDSMTKGAPYCVTFGAASYTLATQDCTQPVTDPLTGQATVTLPAGMTLGISGVPTQNVQFTGNGMPYYANGATPTEAQVLAVPPATVSVTNGSATSSFAITPQTGAVVP